MADENNPWLISNITQNGEKIEVEWVQRNGHVFNDPFFTKSIRRIAAQSQKKVTSEKELLKAFNQKETSPPDGFIFHITRCGSTLLSQLLAAHPNHLVYSEPVATEFFFHTTDFGLTKRMALFIAMIRSYLAARQPNEKKVFFKFCSSSHWLPYIRLAFPTTPIIFLYRDPRPVIASNLANPPPWLVESRLKPSEYFDFLAKRISEQLKYIAEMGKHNYQLLNYEELKFDNLPKLMSLFGLDEKEMKEHILSKDVFSSYSKNTSISWKERRKQESTLPKSLLQKIPVSLMKNYDKLEQSRIRQSEFSPSSKA